jgi:phosphatidylglycerol---prolipoprotein diacylglyceryl transferase
MESLLSYINWNVSPEIFHLGPLTVRWYGLLFVGSFIVGFYLMKKIFVREGYNVLMIDKLTMYMMVSTLIGARLGHCLFYQPDYYLAHPLEILKIWEGGLASHGAAIAIIIGMYVFTLRYKEFRFFWLIDRMVILIALSGFFIRMGNLMNSEIIGKVTDVPWAFVFEQLAPYQTGPRHPTQIYEAICYLILFFFLWRYYQKNLGKFKEGTIFSIFLIALFSIRFFIEFLKEPQVGFEHRLFLNMGQLLSLPFIAAGIALYFYLKNRTDNTEEIEPPASTQ